MMKRLKLMMRKPKTNQIIYQRYKMVNLQMECQVSCLLKKEQPSIKDYVKIKQRILEKVKSLTRQQVAVRKRNNRAMTWRVFVSHDPEGV
jgi:transposase InsO family protein